MRAKEKILDDARSDITNEKYRPTMPYWLVVRQIEVLIDIRDELTAQNKISGAILKELFRAREENH